MFYNCRCRGRHTDCRACTVSPFYVLTPSKPFLWVYPRFHLFDVTDPLILYAYACDQCINAVWFD